MTGLLMLSLLSGCGDRTTTKPDARILVVGDSMLAWNSTLGSSVADVLSEDLRQPVVDRSVSGARMRYALPVSGAAGLHIPKQYRPGNWDWVVINGGGNDLWLGCGCLACAGTLNRLISEDGQSGTIPKFVARLRADGARVLYSGYLRTPGRNSPVDHCAKPGAELERRLALMAQADDGVTFLPLHDLVPHKDLSFHALDRIHPSPKGSAAIAARIGSVIEDTSF